MVVKKDDGSPTTSLQDLIQDVYGDLEHDEATRQEDHLVSRCILSPKNDTTMELNNKVVTLFPGVAKEYLSADTTKEVDDQVRAGRE